MPTFNITGPDGQKYRINGPDGATEDQALEMLQNQLQASDSPTQSPEPPKVNAATDFGGNTLQIYNPMRLFDDSAQNFDTGVDIGQGTQNFLAGTGKAYVDALRGAKQLLGSDSVDAEVNESRALDQDLMGTGAGITGNIAGNVALTLPTAAIPGVGTARGAAAVGAGLGALQPVAEGESRLTNTAIGASAGAAGNALVRGAQRMLNPQTRQEVTNLLREGVPVTPGKILGGGFEKAEDALTSVPLVGDFINSAQNRSLKALNRAAFDRIFKPLGMKTKDIGRAGIDQADNAISKHYDKALNGVVVKLDDSFEYSVREIGNDIAGLAPDMQRKFMNILQNKIMNRAGREALENVDPGTIVRMGDRIGKQLDGRTVKEIESELRRLASGYGKSASFDERELGKVLGQLQRQFTGLVKRQNPESAPILNQADEAYANFLRVLDASTKAGSKEGVFTPAALRGAVKKFDQSMRNKQFGKGNALMQDLSDPAEAILPSKVADSGTARRLIQGGGGLGAGYLIDPTVALTGAAGIAGAGGIYNPLSQRLVAALLAKRPELLRQAGRALTPARSVAGPAGAASGVSIANALREN